MPRKRRLHDAQIDTKPDVIHSEIKPESEPTSFDLDQSLPTPCPSVTSTTKPSSLTAIRPNAKRRRKYEYSPGSSLATLYPHGLGPVTVHLDEYWICLFFRFCAERHRMQVRRVYEGIPRDKLSEDETFTKTHVGNIFRELDTGSKRMREVVIKNGDQSHEEICCERFVDVRCRTTPR